MCLNLVDHPTARNAATQQARVLENIGLTLGTLQVRLEIERLSIYMDWVKTRVGLGWVGLGFILV